ncbi:protein of unknown function [Cupriavidus taiwanensis]|nr:protein of unknown function [Cupriavidus taiwanensis]
MLVIAARIPRQRETPRTRPPVKPDDAALSNLVCGSDDPPSSNASTPPDDDGHPAAVVHLASLSPLIRMSLPGISSRPDSRFF